MNRDTYIASVSNNRKGTIDSAAIFSDMQALVWSYRTEPIHNTTN